jgi:aryl-alcohol dehydrogenase-like predicted oxidoreductase
MAYGIANRTGPLDDNAAHTLLDTAWRAGIRYLDTAQAYGSESIIGRYLVGSPATALARIRITTKLRPDLDVTCADEIQAALADSRERLGRSPVWGMLLHREELLPQLSGRLGTILREWRARGSIRHLGVSVYTEEGMARALETPDIEIIQAPLSPLDRRMRRAGLIADAEAAGKKLFVRSVFLQGLIALEPREAARRLPLAAEAVQSLAAFCEYHCVDPREFAIGYVRHRAPGALLVIGAETPAQIRDNCDLVAGSQDRARAYEEWDSHWPADDPILANPSRWPRTTV